MLGARAQCALAGQVTRILFSQEERIFGFFIRSIGRLRRAHGRPADVQIIDCLGEAPSRSFVEALNSERLQRLLPITPIH
jgi:hypothetical protein